MDTPIILFAVVRTSLNVILNSLFYQVILPQRNIFLDLDVIVMLENLEFD